MRKEQLIETLIKALPYPGQITDIEFESATVTCSLAGGVSATGWWGIVVLTK